MVSIVQVPSPHFRQWGRARRLGDVWHVVLHCDQGRHVVPEPGTAEALARAMALAKPTAKVPWPPSYHYIVDNGGAAQSLAEHQIGRAAREANDHAIHVCIIGRAPEPGKPATEWFGDAALPAVANAAELCAAICDRWAVPWMALDVDAFRAGHHGLVTHATISVADGPGKNDHSDPAGLRDQRWNWPRFVAMRSACHA